MSENIEEKSQLPQSNFSKGPIEGREHPLVGRKVIFVNPPLYVENFLNLELKDKEYEVYILSDYRFAKPALKIYPDAICFFYIDDSLSYDEWFNYIRSFQEDDILKTIFVGVLSANAPFSVKEKYLMNLALAGGFISLNEVKGSKLIDKIIGILDLNGAKGRRKYLRLDCEEETSINGYFAAKSQLFQVSIANISSVGFACKYAKNYGNVLDKNTLIPSFSITLGRKSIVVPSVVFDTRSLDAINYFSVLLFVKQIPQSDRKMIKDFIFDRLQHKFDSAVYGMIADGEDYSSANPKYKDCNMAVYSESSSSERPSFMNDLTSPSKLTGSEFDNVSEMEEL